jgi:hypothetical protein
MASSHQQVLDHMRAKSARIQWQQIFVCSQHVSTIMKLFNPKIMAKLRRLTSAMSNTCVCMLLPPNARLTAAWCPGSLPARPQS